MNPKVMLEDIIGSRNKVKILRILASHELISFSELRKRIGLNYNALKKYLNTLIRAGILKEYEISKFKIYKLRREDRRVKHIIELFKVWDGENV